MWWVEAGKAGHGVSAILGAVSPTTQGARIPAPKAMATMKNLVHRNVTAVKGQAAGEAVPSLGTGVARLGVCDEQGRAARRRQTSTWPGPGRARIRAPPLGDAHGPQVQVNPPRSATPCEMLNKRRAGHPVPASGIAVVAGTAAADLGNPGVLATWAPGRLGQPHSVRTLVAPARTHTPATMAAPRALREVSRHRRAWAPRLTRVRWVTAAATAAWARLGASTGQVSSVNRQPPAPFCPQPTTHAGAAACGRPCTRRQVAH